METKCTVFNVPFGVLHRNFSPITYIGKGSQVARGSVTPSQKVWLLHLIFIPILPL